MKTKRNKNKQRQKIKSTTTTKKTLRAQLEDLRGVSSANTSDESGVQYFRVKKIMKFGAKSPAFNILKIVSLKS